MAKNDLRRKFEKEIKSIRAQLIKKYKPEKVILFGSVARGDFSPDSDLDFLVIKKKTPKRSIDRRRELYRLIDYKIGTDIFVYRPEEFEQRLKMGDPFLKIIVKEGKVLYG